jgi:RimJ/RimL family protein N-acetyltransferase
MTTLKTKRLILRPWQEDDLEGFARLNADPQVREFFPGTLSLQKRSRRKKRLLLHALGFQKITTDAINGDNTIDHDPPLLACFWQQIV